LCGHLSGWSGKNHIAQLSKNYDGRVSLLKLRPHNIKFDVLTFLNILKGGISNMKVARQEHLDWSYLGVDANLALENNRGAKCLSWMRHTHVCLESYCVIQTALDHVHTSHRVLNNRDTLTLNVPFGNTHSFKLHAELRKKTCLDVSLKVPSVQMDVPHKFTTFK